MKQLFLVLLCIKLPFSNISYNIWRFFLLELGSECNFSDTYTVIKSYRYICTSPSNSQKYTQIFRLILYYNKFF